MSSETEDYSSLSLEERATHKVWKVRLGAYEEMIGLFSKTANENDPVFQDYAHADLFKKIVSDSNVVAQETGINCLCKILEFGGSRPATSLKPVITPLCEKSFVSARAGTKLKATEALMSYIEHLDSADFVIEQMLPLLTHKIPKVIAATTKALTDIVSAFGCQTCSPKQIIPFIAKLFAHADKNVRAEATNLSLELYKWLGPAFEDLVFPDLKPIQQKDLKTLFEKNEDSKPQQTRYLRSEAAQIAQQQAQQTLDGDVEMGDSGDNNNQNSAGDGSLASHGDTAQIDAYDLASAVDVIALIPNDFYEKVAAVKWSERKEALEDIYKHLNVIKIEDGNFSDLVRCLSKCIAKDANIQVVTVAANCLEALAKGLRSKFDKYVTMALPSILERTKEKKLSVAEALASSLDSIFAYSGFSYVTDDITKFLNHKTPQVKIATAQFLARCLQKTTTPPSRDEFEMFLKPAVKLLSDSQEPVRSAATEAIGTLMKITGARELNSYLDKVDDNRIAKVKEFSENVSVNCSLNQPRAAPAAAPQPPKTISRSSQLQHQQQPIRRSAQKGFSGGGSVATGLARPSSTLRQQSNQLANSRPSIPAPSSKYGHKASSSASNSLPSKRLATSPLKNDARPPSLPRAGLGAVQGGGVTRSNNTFTTGNTPPINANNNEFSSADRKELEALRQEKLNWLKEKEHLQWKLNEFNTREERLMKEISSLQFKNESLMEEHTKDIIGIKSKDTQLSRLQNDLEIARNKIHHLEQQAMLDQQQQKQQQQVPEPRSQTMMDHHGRRNTSTISPVKSHYVSPFEDPNMGSDLSSKVKRLSIDNGDKENNSPQLDFGKSKIEIDLDSSDDSWRRAAEVTSQLKARIEKMKARSRSNVSNFGSSSSSTK